jgi:hypothetical protein
MGRLTAALSKRGFQLGMNSLACLEGVGACQRSLYVKCRLLVWIYHFLYIKAERFRDYVIQSSDIHFQISPKLLGKKTYMRREIAIITL